MGRPLGSKNTTPSTKVTLICQTCGDEYLQWRSHASDSKYCSRRCQSRAQSRPGFGGRPRARERIIHRSGYALVLAGRAGVGRSGKSRYVPEHRVVMEQVLGRPLLATEFVHHLNGVKTDNRPENLEVWIRRHPAGQRLAEAARHCETCTCPIGEPHG